MPDNFHPRRLTSTPAAHPPGRVALGEYSHKRIPMIPLCGHTIKDVQHIGYGRCIAPLVWFFSPHWHSKLVSHFISPTLIMSHVLTVKEKEHWKDRIGRRIDKQIDSLCVDDPAFMDGVRGAARKRALASLGIGKLQDRLERIQRQEKSLEARKRLTQRQLVATLRRVPLSEVPPETWRFESDIASTVAKRQLVHEDELLAETQRGREVLNLSLEKENLLDTVWLATSPKQIKDLWEKIDELLGGPQTKLQREALAIEPVVED